jgi:hypothetical protein
LFLRFWDWLLLFQLGGRGITLVTTTQYIRALAVRFGSIARNWSTILASHSQEEIAVTEIVV